MIGCDDGSRHMDAVNVRTDGALVLGAMEGMKYRSQEVRLEPGDSLYLYTDGIIEQPVVRYNGEGGR